MLAAKVGTVGTECSRRAENENASTAAMSPVSGITGSRELLARTGATGLGGPVVAAKNATVVRPWGYRDKVETEPNREASGTGARPRTGLPERK
jgi:hypothetical protein